MQISVLNVNQKQNFMKINKKYTATLLFLILAVLMAVLTGGCQKDLGNYDINPVDSLDIGNMQERYQFTIGTKADISPELKFLKGSTYAENDFTYEWASYVGNTSAKKIIHNGKNLDVVIPLAIGNYRVYYVVTQKSTGITWQKMFNLAIYGTFQPGGWFVLNDISGKSRLDYYQEDRTTWNTFPLVYRDFTSLIKDVNTGNAMELTGKPVSITAFDNRDVINSTSVYRLYINTDKETQWINITSGFIWDKQRYVFTNETISGEPTFVSTIYPGFSNGAYAYKDHQLYLYHTTYSLYGTPINRITGTQGSFPISEHLAAPPNTFMHAIFFDTQGKRFLRANQTVSAATVITVTGQGLNMASVEKDLVWMGSTAVFSGQVAAILKDNNNRYYLARISFPYATATSTSITLSVASFEDVTDRLTGIGAADKFVLDQQYGYLFYMSGSKLYQYDMNNKVVKLAKDYGSRTVTLLKYNAMKFGVTSVPSNLTRLGTPGYGIIVGSYDAQNPATSGTVDIFSASALMGDLSLATPSFTGLGKVVDVKYSEL